MRRVDGKGCTAAHGAQILPWWLASWLALAVAGLSLAVMVTARLANEVGLLAIARPVWLVSITTFSVCFVRLGIWAIARKREAGAGVNWRTRISIRDEITRLRESARGTTRPGGPTR